MKIFVRFCDDENDTRCTEWSGPYTNMRLSCDDIMVTDGERIEWPLAYLHHTQAWMHENNLYSEVEFKFEE